MRTLIQFQQEVLAPIRKARNEKIADTYDKEREAKKLYSETRAGLTEDRIFFERKQKRELDTFIKEQQRELSAFNSKQQVMRGASYDLYHHTISKIKQARRDANELYNDQLGLAFAEYNKQRVASGNQPLVFNPFRLDDKEAVKQSEEEQGSSKNPNQKEE